MRSLSNIMLGICILSFGAYATEECTEIRFAHGATSVEIKGEAPPDDVLCYLMRTGANQQAKIQMLEGVNTVVTVLDVADAREEISFTTQARQYEIRVGQLMRAIEAEPFRIFVSVK
ncbi:hypothetical protein [Oceanisphaera sp. IT1-181]|uniref:hypothetical protein n=1 Tax=Oceanisphaera sp. IT1-181 TaxID=3081199 RepID=UPI0029CA94B6|nr:hypothetical protein [Oceanisphaera sp. IT1-181]